LAHINAMETYGYNKCVVGLDIYNILNQSTYDNKSWSKLQVAYFE